MYANPLEQFLAETPLQNLPRDVSQLMKTYQSKNITEQDWNTLVELVGHALAGAGESYTGFLKTLREFDVSAGKRYLNGTGEVFNDYANNEASGEYSHAEGSSTTASGINSHAEGYASTSSGEYSHAEGYNTNAKRWCTHTEGQSTSAESDCAHAEGYDTHAVGWRSHTEGTGTRAEGQHSHAEGHLTRAAANSSHSEGKETVAMGNESHAEGCWTVASANQSHAEGYMTRTEDKFSHTEGAHTVAKGSTSHAEGGRYRNGDQYVRGGGPTVAYAPSSHTEGTSTRAGTPNGDFLASVGAHAEGGYTWAKGKYSHAEGGSVPKDTNYMLSTSASTALAGFDGEKTLEGIIYVNGTSQIPSDLADTVHADDVLVLSQKDKPTRCYDIVVTSVNYSTGKITFLGEVDIEKQYAVQGVVCNIASGFASHSEGYATNAHGACSHASGKGTKATEEAQMAVGTYNAEDSEALFIIGNGTGMSDEQRSNAFVVGKDGNAYVGNDRKKLATVDEVGGAIDIQKYFTYYNYRIAEMTAEYSQAYNSDGTKKVLVLSRRGIDDNDFGYVTNGPFEGVTHVVYNPFRTGSLRFVDINKTKWVLVPKGITSISLDDWGSGVLDLTAFGPDTPFPQLETSVGSVCEVIVPSGRDDIWEMTNWCDASIITEDVSEWFN